MRFDRIMILCSYYLLELFTRTVKYTFLNYRENICNSKSILYILAF